jgi:UDP-N-acetylmuramate dehydrogenase
MFTIEENKDLSALSTFRMASTAHYFARITERSELADAFAFAESHAVPVVILGGGSNTIFTESFLESLVLQIAIPGFEKTKEIEDTAIFRFGAGEVWDDVVARTVEMGYTGLEPLSAIPGSVGGTPVQNVGAYGQEVSNLIVSLDAYDTALGGFVTFLNDDCQFGYRDSIFKQEGKGRYVIVSVDFQLEKKAAQPPAYPGVATYFEKKGITQPSLADIRNAIIEIRKNKLPDPKEIASVGSFFKNPFISVEEGNELKQKYPNAVVFPVNETTVKVGAGWLIDSLGLKGKEFGNLMIYPNNALVIVNKGAATYDELKDLVEDIQQQVREKYAIEIEPEPIFVE